MNRTRTFKQTTYIHILVAHLSAATAVIASAALRPRSLPANEREGDRYLDGAGAVATYFQRTPESGEGEHLLLENTENL